jgi:hypothetical protein
MWMWMVLYYRGCGMPWRGRVFFVGVPASCRALASFAWIIYVRDRNIVQYDAPASASVKNVPYSLY